MKRVCSISSSIGLRIAEKILLSSYSSLYSWNCVPWIIISCMYCNVSESNIFFAFTTSCVPLFFACLSSVGYFPSQVQLRQRENNRHIEPESLILDCRSKGLVEQSKNISKENNDRSLSVPAFLLFIFMTIIEKLGAKEPYS
ncbi:hypothetical protein CLIB1423_11S02696 [[Candida] railenensis]|uniref:Uncharacterized protein n=1 Tax=[Candida] railenensis TaxID=45579 RepID=A0A9P0QRD8_9ASCO|nr:hypothetical protein CLIB1423_11S02696 [[Candida] railenensis]